MKDFRQMSVMSDGNEGCRFGERNGFLKGTG